MPSPIAPPSTSMMERLLGLLRIWVERGVKIQGSLRRRQDGCTQTVYDHNSFSEDDKTGDDEFDKKPLIEALEMNLQGLSSGAVMTRVQRLRRNCLAEESSIVWIEGRVVQDMRLGLRKVECGEVEIQLRWIDLPDSKGL